MTDCTTTRCAFLGGAALGGAAVLAAAAPVAPEAKAPFHLGAATYNVLMDWDLDKIIQTLPGLGFEAVELRTTHKHGVEPSLGPQERLAVRKKFEASKLRLLSYGTICEFQAVDAAVRRENADEKYPWRELFSLLRQAGFNRYTLCEAQASREPERFLRWYGVLWTELRRPV